MPPDPPSKLAPSTLESSLPPTFPVGTSTSKIIDSTVIILIIYLYLCLQKDRLAHIRREAAREEFENMNMVNRDAYLLYSMIKYITV